MKWFVCALCAVALSVLMFCAPLFAGSGSENEYLRIHIRANSNSSVDQEVKYEVKDAVVEALIPLLANAETKDQAKDIISNNLSYIDDIASKVLQENGFCYQGKSRLTKEQFPARAYDDLTLPAGEYDALIVDLGSGQGNNWWCLVYPAFCFTKSKNSTNYEYISKIWDIINRVKRD